MPKNNGKEYERLFVEAINNKRVCQVPQGFRENLDRMYKRLKDDDVIKAGLVDGCQKPDFYVSINGIRKNVSLKTGFATQVGGISLKEFITFMRSKGVSEDTLKTIVLLHFCDGTFNNTGPVRYDVMDFRMKFKGRIKKANKELNHDKSFVKDFVYTVVFKGFYKGNIAADYLYFGSHEFGFCCNFKQICKLIDDKRWAKTENLHIGPIQFRPVARYTGMKVRDDSKRWGVRFYWPGLEGEIRRVGIQYRYHYDGYIPLAERAGEDESNINQA